MCLLFVYTNPDPGPDGYSLVLVNVRDEYFHRPARPADFWENASHIVGGMPRNHALTTELSCHHDQIRNAAGKLCRANYPVLKHQSYDGIFRTEVAIITALSCIEKSPDINDCMGSQ